MPILAFTRHVCNPLLCPVPRLLQVIARAKVPIVKFEDAETGYNFDVSFDVANGPEASTDACTWHASGMHLAALQRHLVRHDT